MIDIQKIQMMIDHYAAKWEHLGRVDGPNGSAVLHQPDRGPLAYGLRVFNPEPIEEIDQFIERESNLHNPEDYRKFLTVYNGINFHYPLSLYGIANRMRRDPSDPVGQAFSLSQLQYNRIEKPSRAGRYFFFGNLLNYSKRAHYVMYHDGFVELWNEEGNRLLNEWLTLEAMLEEELARIDAHCDESGAIAEDVKFFDEGPLHQSNEISPPKVNLLKRLSNLFRI